MPSSRAKLLEVKEPLASYKIPIKAIELSQAFIYLMNFTSENLRKSAHLMV